MTTTLPTGTPSTRPRDSRFYDPTTAPFVDEQGALHLFDYAAVRAGLVGDDTVTIDLADLGPDHTQHVTCRFAWGADATTAFGRPGRHGALRAVAEEMFTGPAVQAHLPLVRAAADAAIDTALQHGPEIDLYHGLAIPYTLRVVAQLVGVSEVEANWLIEQQRKLIELTTSWPPGPQPETDAMLAQVHDRGAVPGTVTDLAARAHAEGTITEREAWAQTWGYVQAGVLTTAATSTAMLGLLVEHGFWRDPAATAGAPDEALRYGAVFPNVIKAVRAPHRRAGHDLVPGQRVVLWISAADRDLAVNAGNPDAPDPRVFDPRRRPGRILALSVGRHYCTGARMARVMLATILERLYTRGVDIELRPGWAQYPGIEDGFTDAPVRLVTR
jgi:cytochrome P450